MVWPKFAVGLHVSYRGCFPRKYPRSDENQQQTLCKPSKILVKVWIDENHMAGKTDANQACKPGVGEPVSSRCLDSVTVLAAGGPELSLHSDWYRHTGTACHRAAAFQATPRNAGEPLSDCLTPSPGSEASLRLEPSAGPPRRQAAGRCGTGSRPLSDCVGLPRRTPSGS